MRTDQAKGEQSRKGRAKQKTQSIPNKGDRENIESDSENFSFEIDEAKYLPSDPEPFNEPEPIEEEIPLPEPDLAPFGLDEGGKPLAPFGYTREGKIKKISGGRPRTSSAPPHIKKPANDREEMFAEVSKGEPAPEPPPAPPLKKEFKVYINGAMFLFALDLIVPNTLSFVYNMFAPDKVRANDLKMTEEERSELKEISDEIVKELLGNLSPLSQFLLYTGMLYGSKIAYAPKHKKTK